MVRVQKFQVLIGVITFLTVGTACQAHAESAGQYINDAEITAKVKDALIADHQLKSLKVSVETDQGAVELSGNVDTKDQEAEAVKVANQISGVTLVKDLLTVKTFDE